MKAVDGRNVSIVRYLASKGIEPARVSGFDYYYHSPIRPGDEKPSFHVNAEKNVFYDFGGNNDNGNAVDLAALMEGDVSLALAALERVSGTQNYQSKIWKTKNSSDDNLGKNFVASEKKKNSPNPDATILEVGNIVSPSLWGYLDMRGIERNIATQYLKQLRYKSARSDTVFFTIGWECGNGFDTRNSIWKGFVGNGKTISVLNPHATKDILIFEGWMDFLSFLTHKKLENFKYSVVILHSTALYKRAIDHISNSDYERVFLYLDNDIPGKKTVLDITKGLSDKIIIDKSDEYKGYDDYNDYWLAIRKGVKDGKR